MQVTSKQTYKVIRSILEQKKFKQYQISKRENVTFSLVNRIVNWLVSLGYVVKRKDFYEVISPTAILNIFPLYRQLKPFMVLDVSLSRDEVLSLISKKSVLCLSSALYEYNDYYRDLTIHAYVLDDSLLYDLKNLQRGFTHIELYKPDLNSDDFVKKGKYLFTTKVRTLIDLFCANKSYICERLIKDEWIK